jgi:hypothetical protein
MISLAFKIWLNTVHKFITTLVTKYSFNFVFLIELKLLEGFVIYHLCTKYFFKYLFSIFFQNLSEMKTRWNLCCSSNGLRIFEDLFYTLQHWLLQTDETVIVIEWERQQIGLNVWIYSSFSYFENKTSSLFYLFL